MVIVSHRTSYAMQRPSSVYGQDERDNKFVVNKTGFPLKEDAWDRLWSFAAELQPTHAAEIAKIRNSQAHPEVDVPKLTEGEKSDVHAKVKAIQDYLSALSYNHTGMQLFEIRKTRCICRLMQQAKEMISESLPIKCLEATILAIHFTNGISSLERFPISFKSISGNRIYRHVVLGLQYQGMYGTLGMSRRPDLMFRPLVYHSLSDLVLDFLETYKNYQHQTLKVKLGLPIPHDAYSNESIVWNATEVEISRDDSSYTMPLEEICNHVDQHSRKMRIFFSRLSPSSKRARALKPAASNGAQAALLSLRRRSQSHDRFTTSHVY